MDLKTFSNILITLPEPLLSFPVEEIRIKKHKEQIVLIHKDHRPMIYNGSIWEILTPQNW